jgi:hypothetical protein
MGNIEFNARDPAGGRRFSHPPDEKELTVQRRAIHEIAIHD